MLPWNQPSWMTVSILAVEMERTGSKTGFGTGANLVQRANSDKMKQKMSDTVGSISIWTVTLKFRPSALI